MKLLDPGKLQGIKSSISLMSWTTGKRGKEAVM